jgi:hypothetical protein
MTDGSLPVGEVNARFRDTLPPETAVPDERASESGPACPKEARADSRAAIAKMNRLCPRVETLLIWVPSVT